MNDWRRKQMTLAHPECSVNQFDLGLSLQADEKTNVSTRFDYDHITEGP
jgi:hypothetical protein